jgi:hypothetical protein
MAANFAKLPGVAAPAGAIQSSSGLEETQRFTLRLLPTLPFGHLAAQQRADAKARHSIRRR